MQRVTILMGVYNGARHLASQLESIKAQSHQNWRLIASDDGSSDDSRSILAPYAEVVAGPRQGFSANFMSLIAAFPEDGDYLAIADQDDFWLPDHLERGLAALKNEEGPAIYCARTFVSDDDLQGRKLSRGAPRGTSFANALVQNVVAGNTIIANPSAARLLKEVARIMPPVPAHDWFAYQLISGAGGRVIFSDAPALIYRQHRSNEMGANNGLRAKWARLTKLSDGLLRGWFEQNQKALEVMRPWLTPENRDLADQFGKILHQPKGVRRALDLRRLGFYRQTRSSTWMLWLAAALGWI